MRLLCHHIITGGDELVTGGLLAGGSSRRLGRAKALLDFGGRPLAAHLLDRLSLFCAPTIILTNDPAPFAGWGYPTAPDLIPGRGPLAGIHAALSAAESGQVFVLACDMPFFSPDLGRLMKSLASGYDAVVPRRGDYLEPLCAIYATSALPAVCAQMATADGRVASFLQRIRVRYLEPAERTHLGPDELLFYNINTPDDLARARSLWPLTS